MIIYSLSVQSITYKCRNNATYEYTSFVAPRHTQRATSQERNTPTETKEYNVQAPISMQCH